MRPGTRPSGRSWPARRSRSRPGRLADLGVDPATVGAAGAATVVRTVAPAPPRQAGTVVVDDGEAAVRIADFLVAQKLL